MDDETRCVHYHFEADIVAMKFKCCDKYFACFSCHEELADHEASVWPPSEFGSTAVLCGKCRTEFSIQEYLDSQFNCPSCESQFNKGCRFHYHLYFEVTPVVP